LSAHRRWRRRQGLGELWRGQDAGLSLGHLPRRRRAEPCDRLRRRDGEARLATGAGRASRRAPAADRDPGRHRAGLGRAAASPRARPRRRLRLACPPSDDLRLLFQVNVEDGPHVGAVFYLPHAFFGRAGREEAGELRARHSGDPDKPRILGTFNEPIADWLSFFMFTYFTDRDGRYQLKSLAESAFDPLSRTCRFMLTEEAYQMFVGRTGITRVARRALWAS